MDDIYPLTVIKDRYTGVYSGGVFTAWNEDYYNIPSDISDDDITCMAFWSDYLVSKKFNVDGNPLAVGIGSTADEAMKDLQLKLNK